MRIGINTAGIAPGWGGAEETFLRHLIRELGKFDASASIVVFTDENNHPSYAPHERLGIEKSTGLETAAIKSGADVVLTSIYRLPGRMACPVLPYATHTRPLVPSGGVRGLIGGSPVKALKSRVAEMPVLVATSKFVQQRLLQIAAVGGDQEDARLVGLDARRQPGAADRELPKRQ